MSFSPRWLGKKAGDPAHERIAACLTTDIQTVPEKAQWVLSEIVSVQGGESQGWEMAMNAYMLNVGPETTDIIPVYEETGEETVSVPTEELRAALEAWYVQITQQSD